MMTFEQWWNVTGKNLPPMDKMQSPRLDSAREIAEAIFDELANDGILEGAKESIDEAMKILDDARDKIKEELCKY